MVIIGPQFTTLDALVDAYQEVSGDVFTIVNPYKESVTQEYVTSIWSVGSRGISIISHTQHGPQRKQKNKPKNPVSILSLLAMNGTGKVPLNKTANYFFS